MLNKVALRIRFTGFVHLLLTQTGMIPAGISPSFFGDIIMGWLFIQNATRNEVINKLIAFEENEHGIWKTHRHCTRGNVLWSIVEWTDKTKSKTRKIIACNLLKKSSDMYGTRKVTSWGYKSMDESVHPSYYTCPPSYLKEAPEVTCEEWREQVRKYNLTYQLGDRLTLHGCKIPYVEVVSVKPLQGSYDGIRYRIPRDMIGGVQHAR